MSTNPDSQPDALIGAVLDDRYELLSLLGEGETGVVYKARHQLMGRLVAIKMLKSEWLSDEKSVKRFQQEARAVSSIRHPNVVAVHDFGLLPDGKSYLAMDLLEGRTLAQELEDKGPIPWRRAVGLFQQAAAGLAHAHHSGIIHRDIKPGNIMIVKDADQADLIKVLDFGIARLTDRSLDKSQRLTATGDVFGSPIYMSPEQCMARELDSRSDVYSFGCVMYHVLAGRPPFAGGTAALTVTQHIRDNPSPFSEIAPGLEIPSALEAIVRKALSKTPDTRHRDMSEVFHQLQEFAEANQPAGLKENRIPSLKRSGLLAYRPIHMRSCRSSMKPRSYGCI